MSITKARQLGFKMASPGLRMASIALLTAAMALAPFATAAQEKLPRIDPNMVEVEVQMHPGALVNLLSRFEMADTTLTPREMRLAYFGFSYTPAYSPCTTVALQSDSAMTEANYPLALALAEQALQENPVSLNLNVLALTAADHLRQSAMMGKKMALYGTRADMAATAILQSGAGTSAHDPFHVNSEADMMSLLKNVLGVSAIIERTRVGEIDAIKVLFPGSARQHILYFDNTLEKKLRRQDKSNNN